MPEEKKEKEEEEEKKRGKRKGVERINTSVAPVRAPSCCYVACIRLPLFFCNLI